MNEPQPFIPLANNSFDGLALARLLLRSISVGVLATLARETGYPFTSLTSVATSANGAPILLFSELAHHTGNLRADSRVSLLLAANGKGDPLAHPRLTIVGRIEPTTNPLDRRRFLRRNAKAALYADFPDFSFWRLNLEGAHLNGGFARAADFPGKDLLSDIGSADALFLAEDQILNEINAKGKPYLSTLASAAGQDHKKSWRVTGLDPDGLDLQARQENGRLVFPRNAPDPTQWRTTLAETLTRSSETSGD
jgi:putative heme iron utilization protein